MDNENNNVARMATFMNTLLALQIIFATATIFCGSANLFMNSRDVGFAYQVTEQRWSYNTRRWNGYAYATTRRPVWWNDGVRPNSWPFDSRTTTTTTTTTPPAPTFGPIKSEMADRFCWDNSGLWGGVLVLLAVLLTVPRAKKGCYAVFQSVSRICGLLICIGTGIAATLWCDPVLDAMVRILLHYNDMKSDGRCPSWDIGDKCRLLREFNVHFAYGIMGVTIATAIFCYLNVALFTLQLLDWIPFSSFFSRFKANPSCIPCGVNCFVGGFVCKFGVYDEDKDGVEQKNVEYKPLIEEGSSNRGDAVTEPGFVA